MGCTDIVPYVVRMRIQSFICYNPAFTHTQTHILGLAVTILLGATSLMPSHSDGTASEQIWFLKIWHDIMIIALLPEPHTKGIVLVNYWVFP